MTQENTEIKKARYWLAVTYPENMVDGWEDDCDELLGGIPYAYCIHNRSLYKDTCSGKAKERKAHVHWIIVFSNTTTRAHALAVINQLSAPGKICCPGLKVPTNIGWAYNYLIHDTDNARKKGKEQYSPEERIEGCGFDIGQYVQISQEEKDQMLDELCQFAVNEGIRDMSAFYVRMSETFDWRYFEVFRIGNAMLDRICRGNDNQVKRRAKPMQPPKCAFCGSSHVEGSYRTEKGSFFFCGNEKCQKAAYTILEQMEEEDEQ